LSSSLHHRHPHSFPTRRSSDLNPWAGPGRHDELALTAAVEVADSSSLLRPPPDRLFVSHAFETRTREALQEFGAELLDSVSTWRSEEHTSELQSLAYLVCRLLL